MRALRPAVILGASLVLGACGSSDSSDDDAKRTTTTDAYATATARYITKADAVCRSANADARRINVQAQKAAKGASSQRAALRAISPLIAEGIGVQKRSVQRFEAIDPPAPDRPIIGQITQSLDAQLVALRRQGSAAKSANVARYNAAAADADRLSQRVRKLGRAYHFRECGNGSGS